MAGNFCGGGTAWLGVGASREVVIAEAVEGKPSCGRSGDQWTIDVKFKFLSIT